MLEILKVMCMIPVAISPDYIDIIVTQGKVLEIRKNSFFVDFNQSLVDGNYNLELNKSKRNVYKNNCKVLGDRLNYKKENNE
jgi:hypothetical protein